MTAEPSQTARSRRLGLELRKLREDNRLTLEMASTRMDRSVSSISRIENGKVSLPVRDLPHFLDVYGVTDPTTCEALTALARDAQKKDWWGKYGDVLTAYPDFISLENDATKIRTFEALLIPGLFQTRGYARAIIEVAQQNRPPQVLKRLTDVRMTRQRILDREDPPDYHAIIGEAALRQLVGGRSVMRRQLRHLAELVSHDRVTLQVLPFAAGAHAAAGSFTVLTVPAFGDIVNIDNTAGRTKLDDSDATDRYNVVFDGLRSRALPEPGSRAIIERLAADL